MCPTNPQKDPRSRKGNERFSGTSLGMKFLGSIDARDGSSELTPCASRLTPCDREVPLCSMLYALCATRGCVPLATCALRLTVIGKWRRIGWKNVCGAPMGKGRAIQRLGGGDIPAPSKWSYLPGQAMVTGTDPLRLALYDLRQ